MSVARDPTLDVLLYLDGQVLVVDPEGRHWVRFVVTHVSVSPEKPHGIDHSLTLHVSDGERLVGFDNAHPVGRQRRGEPQAITIGCDASGRTSTGMQRPCLPNLEAVDAVLRERGVIP